MLNKLLSTTDKTIFYTKEENPVVLSTQAILFLFTDESVVKFPAELSALGRNSHEKAAFLYLLIELQRYNLILNKPIYNEDQSACIKEFDAIDAHARELFEDKHKLGKESLEKIFGSKHPNRTAHTQVLGDSAICERNNIPVIKILTITYSFIEVGLYQYPLGKLLQALPHKQQITLTISEMIDLLKPVLFKTAYMHYLQDSGLEQIQFIRIPNA